MGTSEWENRTASGRQSPWTTLAATRIATT